MTDTLEGPLYIEISKTWEESYCMITTDGDDRVFQAFKKIRMDVPASKSNKSNQILLEVSSSYYHCYYSSHHV